MAKPSQRYGYRIFYDSEVRFFTHFTKRCYGEKGEHQALGRAGVDFAENKARRAKLPGGSESNWGGNPASQLVHKKKLYF
jgi:hypothetical protein